MINRLQIDGYRLLDGFDADLGQLTVVIGANATGKSTLIDCLRCIGDCAQFPLQRALDMHGGIFSIPSASESEMRFGWKVEFQEPRNSGKRPRTSDRGSRRLTYEVQIEGKRTGEVLPVYEVLRTTEPLDKDYKTPFKYLEVTRSRAMIYDFRQHRLVPIEEVLSQQGDSDQTAVLPGFEDEEAEQDLTMAPAHIEQEQSLQLAQMRFPVHKVLGLASRVRVLFANIAFYPGFNVGPGADLRTKPAAIRPETYLWFDGRNLGTVLHEVLTRHGYRQSAEQLNESLRAAYPSFEGITAETVFGATPAVLVRVHEKGMGRGMEMWDLSDGMLRFLCLGTALLNPLPSPLIAIDEPEAGLHPRLLPIVADMIKSASEKTQVLITTHSPDLLNNFDLDDVAVMVRDGPRAKWYRPGTRESLHKMLQAVEGETLGELHKSGELEAIAE